MHRRGSPDCRSNTQRITSCWKIASRPSRRRRLGGDHLEAHIEAALPDWSLTPVVKALQALRGLALVAAATLVGGGTRRHHPFRQSAGSSWPIWVSFLPSLLFQRSEHATTGARNHQGGQWRGAAHVDRGGMELPVSSTYRSRSPSAPRKVEQANPRHNLEGPGATFCRRYRKLAHAWEIEDRDHRRDCAQAFGASFGRSRNRRDPKSRRASKLKSRDCEEEAIDHNSSKS